MNRLICSDAREALAAMPEQSVHCCITSPPYWSLRDYGCPEVVFGGDEGCEHQWGEFTRPGQSGGTASTKVQIKGKDNFQIVPDSTQAFCSLCGAWRGQLGLEPTPEAYVEHMVEYFRAVRRVLRDDGTLWLNLGDSYAGSGVHAEHHANPGLSKAGKRHAAVPTYVAPGLKPKDLCMIPFRVAMALQADGWWLRSVIPWIKRNPMPESVRDRPTTAHEYVFLLTKSGTKQYWTHPRKRGTGSKPEPDYRWGHKLTGLEVDYPPVSERILKKFWSRRNLWQGHDYYWDADAIRMPGTSGPSGIRKMVEKKDRIGGKNKVLDDPFVKASAHTNIGRKRAVGSPTGRNRRSSDWFFESLLTILFNRWQGLLITEEGDPLALLVNTHPYKGPHYATFPAKLVEPMVLAGTSHKVCAECGAPWERVVDSKPNPSKADADDNVRDWANTHQRTSNPQSSKSLHRNAGGVYYEGKTLGFRPTCSCSASTAKAVILDPFGGTGTVAEVCRKHGRDWIIIDIDPKSIEMTGERLKLGPVEYETNDGLEWIQPELIKTGEEANGG